MEAIRVKSLIFMVVALSLMMRQTRADFPTCYGTCYVGCLVGISDPQPQGIFDDIPKRFCPCAWKCLKQCLPALPHAPTINEDDDNKSVDYFCTLGCSMSACENVQHDKEKFGGCVHHCSTNRCKNSRV